MNTNTYTIDLSPKSQRLYAKQLPELVEHYLAAVARDNQAKTAYGYRAKLRYALKWWQEAGSESEWMLGAEELAKLNDYLDGVIVQSGNPMSYNSRADVLRRLAQCLRWAKDRGCVLIDLSADVPAPRGMTPDRKPVSIDMLQKLLGAASTSKHPGRDLALVAMLAGTGIRCEECAALLVCDVALDADGSGYAILRTTKFDKPRTVAIDQETGRYLRPWLDVLQDDQPLFPSRKGGGKRPLSPSGVYRILVELALDAGVRKQFHGAHDLRRMFATLWLRNLPGAGYGELLQRQLGHSSFSTTQRYSLQDVDRVIQVMRQEAASPMAQLAENQGTIGFDYYQEPLKP